MAVISKGDIQKVQKRRSIQSIEKKLAARKDELLTQDAVLSHQQADIARERSVIEAKLAVIAEVEAMLEQAFPEPFDPSTLAFKEKDKPFTIPPPS